MNKQSLLGGLLAMLMAAALFAFAPALSARSQYAAGGPSTQSQAPQSHTFVGKIMQLKNGRYALVTGTTAAGGLAGHYLDDDADAKRFVGRNVKVTGTFDAAANMIHVTKIQAA